MTTQLQNTVEDCEFPGRFRDFPGIPFSAHFGRPLLITVMRAFPACLRAVVFIAVLLDPPMNLSVRQTGKPGQLHMKWLPPPLKYMDDSIIYEVGFSTVGSELRKVRDRELASGVNCKLKVHAYL